MGDADASGVAQNDKFAETEYEDAINAAIELVKENYLLPAVGTITWVEDTFNYAPPTGMIALHTIRGRRGADNISASVTRTPESYEVLISLDIVSVQRDTDGTLKIHFDEESIKARNFNVDNWVLRVDGYKYQAQLAAAGDSLEINYSVVLLLAKAWLHLTGSSRDWNDMMKHLRQWQAVLAEVSARETEDFEQPDTLWLDRT